MNGATNYGISSPGKRGRFVHMNTLRPAPLGVNRAKASSLRACLSCHWRSNGSGLPPRSTAPADGRTTKLGGKPNPAANPEPWSETPIPDPLPTIGPHCPEVLSWNDTEQPRADCARPAAARSVSSARTQRVRSPRCTGRKCTGRAARSASAWAAVWARL